MSLHPSSSGKIYYKRNNIIVLLKKKKIVNLFQTDVCRRCMWHFPKKMYFKLANHFRYFFLFFTFCQKPPRPNAMKISHSLFLTLIKPSITGCLMFGNSLRDLNSHWEQASTRLCDMNTIKSKDNLQRQWDVSAYWMFSWILLGVSLWWTVCQPCNKQEGECCLPAPRTYLCMHRAPCWDIS